MVNLPRRARLFGCECWFSIDNWRGNYLLVRTEGGEIKFLLRSTLED